MWQDLNKNKQTTTCCESRLQRSVGGVASPPSLTSHQTLGASSLSKMDVSPVSKRKERAWKMVHIWDLHVRKVYRPFSSHQIFITSFTIPMSSYLVGVLLGGFLPFSCYPFVIAAPCLIFLPLSLLLTDTPLWLTMQVCLVMFFFAFGFRWIRSFCQNCPSCCKSIEHLKLSWGTLCTIFVRAQPGSGGRG